MQTYGSSRLQYLLAQILYTSISQQVRQPSYSKTFFSHLHFSCRTDAIHVENQKYFAYSYLNEAFTAKQKPKKAEAAHLMIYESSAA